MEGVETIKHTPMVYRVYDYLKANHLGRNNGIIRKELADRLDLTERELRRITKEINESTDLARLISTTEACYMCDTKEECEYAIRNTYRVAVALLKKAKQMERRVGLNGQVKIKLGKYYKEVVETFSREE